MKELYLLIGLLALAIALSGCTQLPTDGQSPPTNGQQPECQSNADCRENLECIEGKCVAIDALPKTELEHYIDVTAEDLEKDPVFYSEKRVCVFSKYKDYCMVAFLDENVWFRENYDLKAVKLIGKKDWIHPPIEEEIEAVGRLDCSESDYNKVIACGLFFYNNEEKSPEQILQESTFVTGAKPEVNQPYQNNRFALVADILIEAEDAEPEKITVQTIGDCNSFSSEKRKDICLFDFVVNKRENDDCGQISTTAIKSSCYWNTALTKKQPELCEELDFSGIENSSLQNVKDNCLVELAGTDPEYCNKMQAQYYKQWCLENVAVNAAKPEICMQMGSADYEIGGCLAKVAVKQNDHRICIDANEDIMSECFIDYKWECAYNDLARCLKINCSKESDCEDYDACTEDECVIAYKSGSGVCKNTPIENCSYGEWDDFSSPQKTWETYISGLKEKNKEKVNSCLTAYAKQNGAAHNDESKYDSVLSFLGNLKFKAEINGNRAFLWPDPPTTKFGPVFFAKENGRWKIELQLVRQLIIYAGQNDWFWKYNDSTYKDRWLEQGE